MLGQKSFALITCLCVSACKLSPVQSTQPNSESVPVEAAVSNEEILSVAVGKVASRILPGTVLGSELDEFNKPTEKKFYAPQSLSPEMQKELTELLEQRFKEFGITPRVRNSAFGLDDAWRADLQLRANIVSLRLNTYGMSSSRRAEAWIAVDWELIYGSQEELVHQATTRGESSGAESVWTAELSAFRQSADRFLAQKQTQSKLRGSFKTPVVASNSGPQETRVLPATERKTNGSLEQTLQTASQAVFSIQNGSSHGSGFFIRADGLALTARHVIAGRKSLEATLPNRKTIQLQVIAEAENVDLALLQASEGQYEFLPLSHEDLPHLGQEIYAIGTPVYLNLSQSISKGIVSAIRPEVSRTTLQTDLAINPGSSGGPVINEKGEVIAIVDRKLMAPDVQGIGFCVAIRDAKTAFLLVHP